MENEEETKEGQDEDDGEYEDLQVIDLGKAVSRENEVKEKYKIITHRYHTLIPHMKKLLKSREPAPTLKYLILSNLLTLGFLFRLHNGEVLDPEV